MNIITLDFETFFSDDYSLKKMTTEAYVRDPRFEVLGCAVRYPDGVVDWLPNDQCHNLASSQLDVKNSAVLCHHAHFDGLILSHRYGIKPHAWLDTLSMARLMLGNHVSVSLASVAAHYGLAPKSVPYDLFKNKHWADLAPDVQSLVGTGACHDVELTWQCFCELAKGFPAEEFQTVDSCVRMFTEPVLLADVAELGKLWSEEEIRRQRLLAECQLTAKDLRSDAGFAALLRAEGAEPPTKPGKNGPIYAFAKTDRFLKELPEHDNPRVAALAEARLGTKTSILQTRAERMAYMAQRGPLCIYLNYAGAHTSRFSGGDKLNFQNPPPALKRTIKAPPGHKLAIVDASQIECRILNYVAGQWDKIEEFRQGKDPYVGVASEFCGYEVNKKDHPIMRQGGKVVELQGGFGSGGDRIEQTLRIFNIPFTKGDGEKWKIAYRAKHPCVVDYWRQAEGVLDRLHNCESSDWGVLRIRGDRERGQRRIVLPNGIALIYDTLEWHADADSGDRYWRIKTRDGYAKLYGAKLVENIVQALARVVVTQAMSRVKAAGIRIATMTHDDIVCVLLEDSIINDKFEFIKAAMKHTPEWLPGIPLDCDGVLSERYEK